MSWIISHLSLAFCSSYTTALVCIMLCYGLSWAITQYYHLKSDLGDIIMSFYPFTTKTCSFVHFEKPFPMRGVLSAHTDRSKTAQLIGCSSPIDFFQPTTIKLNCPTPQALHDFPIGAVSPCKQLLWHHMDTIALSIFIYNLYFLGTSLWCYTDFSTLYFMVNFVFFFLFQDEEGAQYFRWLSTRFLEMQVPSEDAPSLTG